MRGIKSGRKIKKAPILSIVCFFEKEKVRSETTAKS